MQKHESDEKHEEESLGSLYIPPPFKSNIEQVIKWFEKIPINSDVTEVEGRLGKFDTEKRRFDSQVDTKWFAEKLAYFMAPGAQWDSIEEETTTSYLFDDGIRAIQRQDETATFVKKVRKSSIDLRFEDCAFDVRIAYSLEIPKAAPQSTPIWVRMRHRKSFRIGPFRFDFSNIMEAKTQQEAAAQKKVKHEIEIEYVGNAPEVRDTLQNAMHRSKMYLAVSLLFKLHDLITPNGSDCGESAHEMNILQIKQRRKQSEHKESSDDKVKKEQSNKRARIA